MKGKGLVNVYHLFEKKNKFKKVLMKAIHRISNLDESELTSD